MIQKRYLLIIKNNFGIITDLFYTVEEAKAVAKNTVENTIIDLEDKNINWQGCE